jgi:hypothetical protein
VIHFLLACLLAVMNPNFLALFELYTCDIRPDSGSFVFNSIARVVWGCRPRSRSRSLFTMPAPKSLLISKDWLDGRFVFLYHHRIRVSFGRDGGMSAMCYFFLVGQSRMPCKMIVG